MVTFVPPASEPLAGLIASTCGLGGSKVKVVLEVLEPPGVVTTTETLLGILAEGVRAVSDVPSALTVTLVA